MSFAARPFRVRNTSTQACVDHTAIVALDCNGVITGITSWLTGVTASTTAPVPGGSEVLEQGPCVRCN